MCAWRGKATRRRLAGTVGLVVAVVVSAAGASQAAAATASAPPPTPTFQELWDNSLPSQVYLSTPVVATLQGEQAVVVGDSNGDLYAYDLATGAAVPGWPVTTDAANYNCTGAKSCPYVKFGVSGPVSAANLAGSSNSTIFVEAGGGNAVGGGAPSKPDFQAFNDAGTLLYRTNAADTLGDSLVSHRRIGSNPGLSGVALTQVGSSYQGFAGGTTGHLEYGINAATGATAYTFQNADTSLGTPAVANVTGVEEAYEISDASYNRAYIGSFSGGHLRAFTTSGKEVCNANLDAPNPEDNYAGSSFVNSPAIGSLGGAPLVVFGQGNRFTGSDHVEAYDAACQPVWSTPALAGPTNFSPVIADAAGPTSPVVIEETGNAAGNPVIYEIGANGQILASTTLSGCSGISRDTTSQSVVTADLTGLGYQDLVAPAGTCGFAVLDGKSLAVVPTGSPSGFLQPTCDGAPLESMSTALVTATPTASGSLVVTLPGYSPATGGGCVAAYAVNGVDGEAAAIGTGAWPEFHQNPQLTGLATTAAATRQDVLGDGADLVSGQELTSPNGSYLTLLRGTGSLVVGHQVAGKLDIAFATDTPSPPASGARVTMAITGDLVVRATSGQVVWQSFTHDTTNPTYATMQANGVLAIYEGPRGPNEAATSQTLWTSSEAAAKQAAAKAKAKAKKAGQKAPPKG